MIDNILSYNLNRIDIKIIAIYLANYKKKPILILKMRAIRIERLDEF